MTTGSPGDLKDLWEICLSTVELVTAEMGCVYVRDEGVVGGE